jgi:hypothetical protein
VKRITFDASALIRGCVCRVWRQGDREARQLLALIFGTHTPYARSRKMLPMLERAAGVWFPAGPGADPVVDFGKGELLEILAGALKQSMRNRATNPEFAFVSRAELGLHSLLHQLNAKANATAAWQRVERSGPPPAARPTGPQPRCA